ncbi:MAG: hypothetical protein OIN88_07005 [Candidatus Methanoperedens sp.]|nr:hypothetical protein [Candidatus Methanoperedens sp.]MCZ7359902.1 hypothetical protein [Candidatus Methanoperedens sp.]HLB71758.1 hypothetical protein [Candidatus Methanoperedens sp.]
MIGETQGKITGNRVLPSDGQAPKVESSFQDSGKILGVEITNIGTYWSIVRGGGLYGEGQGIIMTRDGEMAYWTGQGVGRFTGRGSASIWRGSLFYQTSSQKLAHLNSIAVVFEYEVDENGNTHDKLWEWK